jgi:hypothetical protein
MAAGTATAPAKISVPQLPTVQPFAPALQMWKIRGEELARDGKRQQWSVADWLVAGCDLLYAGKEVKKAKDVYDNGEKLFGYSRGSLIQFAYVARAFPESIRIDSLTFGHHQAAMAAPEDARSKWLQAAARNKTSIAEFRKIIQKDCKPAKARKPESDKFSLPGLPEADLKKLKLLAQAQDKSVASVTVAALGDYLRKNTGKLRAAEKELQRRHKVAVRKLKAAHKVASANLKKAKAPMIQKMKTETIVAPSWQARLKQRVANVMMNTPAHTPAAFIQQFDKFYGAEKLPMFWVAGRKSGGTGKPNTLFGEKRSWRGFNLASYTREEEKCRQTNCKNEHREIMGGKVPPAPPVRTPPTAPTSAAAVAAGAGFGD